MYQKGERESPSRGDAEEGRGGQQTERGCNGGFGRTLHDAFHGTGAAVGYTVQDLSV